MKLGTRDKLVDFIAVVGAVGYVFWLLLVVAALAVLPGCGGSDPDAPAQDELVPPPRCGAYPEHKCPPPKGD